jgi:RNA polymerase-binding transcription factor DksA
MALTEEQRARLKARLEDELRRLTADAEFTQNTFVDASHEYERGGDSPPQSDEADTATELFNQEHQLAIEGMLQATREQVEHALRRMEEGTYGICEVCGKEIPYERLEALPHATLCVEDQARRDPPLDPREDPIHDLRPY